MNVIAMVEEITPEIAASYLATMPAQRTLSKDTVAKYARDMTAGRWVVTNQGIGFDEDGHMFDGQHRMKAVIASGCTIEILVVRRVPSQARAEVDSGKVRSFSDDLALEGEKNTKDISAIVRKAFLWEQGSFWSRHVNPSKSEQHKFLEDHPDIYTACHYAIRGRGIIRRSAMGFCYWLFAAISPEDAETFLTQVQTGIGLYPGMPALALRERIERDKNSRPRGFNIRDEHTIALIILAWNGYRRDNKMVKIQLPSEPLSDSSFPRPI